MRVLVTGVGGPAGRNVVSHSPKDWDIITCDADSRSGSRISTVARSISKFYTVPYAKEEKRFTEAVNKIVSGEKIDFIIPTVDEELVVFSKNPNAFETRVIISPYRTISTCDDKYLFYDKFNHLGFAPKYVVTDSRENLIACFGKDKILMKPRVGRGSRGIRNFENVSDVPDELINKENVFCEYLPGYEYTADVICDFDGNPIIIIPRKRLEVHRGVCVRGKMEKNQEIIENIEKMCEVLKFIGPINIQFKLDSNGRPKLVEANPRFSGGLPITIKAGINTLSLLDDVIQGRKIEAKNLEWEEIESTQDIERPDNKRLDKEENTLKR